MEGGIRVSRAALDAIVQLAREAAPAECCGLLLGKGSTIDVAAPAANIAGEPRSRFLIDPKDHIDVRRAARARGLDVVGFYHSHPRAPALPSATDRAEAAYPSCYYLIVSLATDPPDIGLFQLDGHDGLNFLSVAFVAV